MKKIAVLAIAFLLFIPFASINGSNVASNMSTNNILYVGGSGPNNYTKIQSAINDASNGYTIYVYAGIYREHIRIYKPINLIGENENTTIIDGMNETNVTVFSIDSDNVNFSHFTIRNILGGFWVYGIVASGNNITISDCIIRNSDGLKIYSVEDGLIENCNFSHNYWGIFFATKCKNITIKNCTITYNLGKRCEDGGWIGGDGIKFMFNAYNFDDISVINCNLSNNRLSGIDACNFKNLYVSNCSMDGSKWGISMLGMKNVTVLSCEFKNNLYYGIDIINNTGNTLIKNCNITSTKNWSGIKILGEKEGKIYIDSCSIKNNDNYGIEIRNSRGVYIRYSDILNNQIGVLTSFSMVDARYNYWGSPFGPSHLLGLKGDRIIARFSKVFYFPWLVKDYGE